MLLDQGLDFRNLLWLQTEVAGQLHGRIDPELRFAIGMLNVNVSSSFLTGKEVKPISLDPQDRRTHRTSIAEATPAEDIATTRCRELSINRIAAIREEAGTGNSCSIMSGAAHSARGAAALQTLELLQPGRSRQNSILPPTLNSRAAIIWFGRRNAGPNVALAERTAAELNKL